MVKRNAGERHVGERDRLRDGGSLDHVQSIGERGLGCVRMVLLPQGSRQSRRGEARRRAPAAEVAARPRKRVLEAVGRCDRPRIEQVAQAGEERGVIVGVTLPRVSGRQTVLRELHARSDGVAARQRENRPQHGVRRAYDGRSERIVLADLLADLRRGRQIVGIVGGGAAHLQRLVAQRRIDLRADERLGQRKRFARLVRQRAPPCGDDAQPVVAEDDLLGKTFQPAACRDDAARGRQPVERLRDPRISGLVALLQPARDARRDRACRRRAATAPPASGSPGGRLSEASRTGAAARPGTSRAGAAIRFLRPPAALACRCAAARAARRSRDAR